MIPQSQENLDAIINNVKNEIGLLLFHKETMEMKINYLRPKLESPIAIVGEVHQDTYFPNEKTNWNEKDIPVREAFFHANNELLDVVGAINAKQLALSRLETDLKKHQETQQKGIDKHKMADLISKAKGLLNNKDVSKENKDKLRHNISLYEKGIYSNTDKTAFFQRLENLVFELK